MAANVSWRSKCRVADEAGFSLVETMIAMLILVIALLSLSQLFCLAIALNKNHGRDATKATAFAHDKMEELKGLAFGDTTTNITVDPPYPANGVGLSAGGSIPPAAAATNYVDYLDQNGVRTTAANSAFSRQWNITAESPTLKRISVAVTSSKSFNVGPAPATVSVTYKTQ